MTDDRRDDGGGRRLTIRKGVRIALLALVALTVVWWAVVRITASDRALQVRGAPASAAVSSAEATDMAGTPEVPDAPAVAALDTIRVLAWNIAHARGDLMQGTLQNFRGGDGATRTARMIRIARVILEADADVVALNEVDFDAAWSDGLNQAEALARGTGYDAWVEQRNFDYSLLLADFAFGNALLSRLPIEEVRPVPIPPHRRIEAALIGAKTAAVVRIETAAGPVAVVPIHLEFRDAATRLAAVPPLAGLRDDAPPLILAGDFNSSPPGWPGADPTTAVGELMRLGWQSPRAAMEPASGELTFPSPDPARAIDWVLAEPPLRILESRVVRGDPELSDHLPVLAVIEVRRDGTGPGHGTRTEPSRRAEPFR